MIRGSQRVTRYEPAGDEGAWAAAEARVFSA